MNRHRGISTCIILLLSAAVSILFPQWYPVRAASPAYPLKRAADPAARYLVDQDNRPVFINADTAWSLMGQVSQEDADYYLKDAAAKGFNTVIATQVESYYADNAPKNYYNVNPYLTYQNGVPLFNTPNEAYFAHADWVINKAAEYGIQIILAPNYLGCCSDGYYDELNNSVNTESAAAQYGTFIGNRYKSFPNLIFVWGDDLNPGSVRSKINAMASAVKAADPNHLQTYHGGPEYSSLDDWSLDSSRSNYASWLSLNATYTYSAVIDKLQQDYRRSPFLPFLMFETQYEVQGAGLDGDTNLSLRVRKEAYVAILAGAAGNAYGNEPIWEMNGREHRNPIQPGQCPVLSAYNTNPYWKCHLNDPGRRSMQQFRALFESRDWTKLVPDSTNIVSPHSSGQDYVGAARTADGNTIIAYMPSKRTLTVDLTKITGTQVKAWWFNPNPDSPGTSLIGTYPTTGPQSFTPASNGDWVLVIDNAALNLTAPGSNPSTTVSPTPTGTGKSGDGNGDNRVDGADYVIWLNHYGSAVNGAANGDYDGNGRVDGKDYVVWLENFGR